MTENLKKAAKKEKAELEAGHEEAIREREKPTEEIKIVGKTFTIPKNAPAWVQLFVAKYGVGEKAEVPPEKYLDFIVKVLGDDIIDHLLEEGDNYFDSQDFEEQVMSQIMGVWYPQQAKKKK